MRYTLDTEFNGFGGDLLSLALVREDGESLYLVTSDPPPLVEWVAVNVWPIMHDCPADVVVAPMPKWPAAIAHFFAEDLGVPYVISDWPDDIRYLCQALITGPGMMAPVPRIQFDVVRVDAYPTALHGAVQHNAWWDAMALRARLFPAAQAISGRNGKTGRVPNG